MREAVSPSSGGSFGTWVRGRAGLSRCSFALAAIGLAAPALGVRSVGEILVAACLLLGVLVGASIWHAPRWADACPIALLLAAACLGMWWGAVRAEQIVGGPLASVAHQAGTWVVTLDQDPQVHAVYASAPCTIMDASVGRGGQGPRLSGQKIWLELKGVSTEGIGAGSVLQVKGTVEEPSSAASGFDQAEYLKTKGIGWVLHASGKSPETVGRRTTLGTRFCALRHRICGLLSLGVPATHASVMQGILLGVKDGIPEHVTDDFRLSGLSHMLTVSGSHIAWLIAGMLLLLRGLRLPRSAGLLGATIVVVLFAPLTDGGPSVQRAAIVGLLAISARFLGRACDVWQLLILAGVILLAGNPFLLFAPGMQLSFASVAGILLLAGPIQRRLHRLPAAIAEVVAITTAATLGTAPLVLTLFGQVPLGSVPANLLAGPVMPMVTGLCFASGFLGLLWPGCALFLNQAASVLVEWCMDVAKWCSRIPVLPLSSVGFLAGAGAGLLVGWLFLRRRPAKSEDKAVRRRRRLWLLGAMVVGAVLYLPAAFMVEQVGLMIAPSFWPPQGGAAILDVGQGSAALIRSAEGSCVLVDAGPSDQGLERMLQSLRVRQLDMVVISHPHADHYGGLQDLLGCIPVRLLLDGPGVLDEGAAKRTDEDNRVEITEITRYRELRSQFEGTGTVCTNLTEDEAVSLGGSVLNVLVPRLDGADSADLNEASLVVDAAVGGIDILLCGDAEATALRLLPLRPVDVFVVGHHGSKGAVTADLLGQVHPALSIISVGRANRFGHPHGETIAELEAWSGTYLRTDQVGTVTVGGTGVPGEVLVRARDQAAASSAASVTR